MKKGTYAAGVTFMVVWLAIFGWPPSGRFNDDGSRVGVIADYRDTGDVLIAGYGAIETGAERQRNGVFRVRALTRMPGVKAEMVRWWFADYMQTTEHYRRWHPDAHVWMDWENKVPGEIVGASHLVHEYIGDELLKLRIQFVPPEEFLEEYAPRDGRLVLCARVGLLEEPINVATMCHLVRDTEWGAEMRSFFWMGHIASRNGNEDTAYSLEALLGNLPVSRFFAVDEDDAVALMTHAIEEMGYLSDFLPELYAAR